MTPASRTLGMGTVLLLLLVGISWIPGCGSDDPSPCYPSASGTISGHILSGGEPTRVRVGALQVQPGGSSSGQVAYIQTVVDSSGAYRLDVPTGRYILRMDGFGCDYFYAHGILVEESEAETLDVDPGESLVADLESGSLRVEVTFPTELEGTRVAMRLVRDGDGCSAGSSSGDVSNGHATFIFQRLLPGTYRVSFSPVGPGWFEAWLPGTTFAAEADTIVISSGRARTFESALPSPAVLRGRVTGSWQELGQSAPQIVLVSTDEARSLGHTGVNPADGSFEFHLYAHARFLLEVDMAGFPRWYGGSSRQTATPIEIEPGHEFELNLTESGISGWLNRSVPASAAEVWLYDADGNARGHDYATGSRGFFRISNLTEGTYFLKVEKSADWIEQWYDRADSIQVATPIHVTGEGEVAWVNLSLEEGGRIEGRLMREDGAPAYGVRLELIDLASSAVILISSSNGEDGAFVLRALPDGDYILAAHPGEAQTSIYYPGVTESWQATVLSVRDHATIPNVFFDLP